MEAVIFLPGIMGCVLKTPQGETVWPPTPLETQFGYKRTDELLRDDLVVTDVVRSVLCFGVYQPLIDQLHDIGFSEGDPAKRLEIFAYDWRRDLEGTADLLAARMASVAQAGADAITLVAHSMGGLVARLALESGKFDTEPWFGKVVGLFTIGTPHLGAPLALARVLGMEGALGISGADFRKLANDSRYPTGYQLLPAPTEEACWDIRPGMLPPIDIYDPVAAQGLGLDPVLMARARFVFDTLAAGSPPKHVRYFYFAASGHQTPTRLNVGSAGKVLTRTDDAGDGTVPLWSALPRSKQKQVVIGEHASFFTERAFKAVFYRLLGKSFPAPPVALAGMVALSVHAIMMKPNERVEVVLVPGEPTGQIGGTLVLERTEDEGVSFSEARAPVQVSYSGPEVPKLTLRLPPIAEPGLYQLRFLGQPGSSDPARFAVNAAM